MNCENCGVLEATDRLYIKSFGKKTQFEVYDKLVCIGCAHQRLATLGDNAYGIVEMELKGINERAYSRP